MTEVCLRCWSSVNFSGSVFYHLFCDSVVSSSKYCRVCKFLLEQIWWCFGLIIRWWRSMCNTRNVLHCTVWNSDQLKTKASSLVKFGTWTDRPVVNYPVPHKWSLSSLTLLLTVCWSDVFVWVQKIPPALRFSDFFPKWLGIFNRFFTHLLYVHIYTRLQIFIQLSPMLTKLCHTKLHHPSNLWHFTRT